GRPPDDWPELLAVARAHPGKVAFKGSLYEGLTCDVLPFVWAAGGSGDVLDDAGALAAFRFFAELAPSLHPESATFREPTVAEARRGGGGRRRGAGRVRGHALRGPAEAGASRLRRAQPALAGGVSRRRLRAPEPRCGAARRGERRRAGPIGRAARACLGAGR